ncbi:MAG: hypothetical protein ACE5JL_12280 [Dehalococcoidia bacterium]
MWWRPRQLLIASLVLALGLGTGLYFGIDSATDPILPDDLFAQVEETANDFLAQLGPGKVVHTVGSYYARQGPSAAKVSASDWPQPETSFSDSWQVFGPDGMLIDQRGVLRDAVGNIWQETARVGDEVVSHNFYTGEELTDPWRPLSISDYQKGLIVGFRKSIEGQQDVDQGRLFGLASAIFSKSRAVNPQMDHSSDSGFVIPDMSDLSGESVVTQREVAISNPLLSRWSVYLVDSVGERHVVEQQEQSMWEVINISELPDDLRALPSWASGK